MANAICAFACAGVALSFAPARAEAHDPPIALDGDRLDGHTLVTTSRGLVVGDDATGTWSLVCNLAVNTTSSQSPPPRYINSDLEIALATLNGLLHADPSACGWVGNPLLGDRAVVDLRYDVATERWWSVVSDPALGGTLASSPDAFDWTEHGTSAAPYFTDAVPSGDGTVWVSTIRQVPETGDIEFGAQPWLDGAFGDSTRMPARDDDYLVELAAASPERLTALHLAYSGSGALDQLRELTSGAIPDEWDVVMEAQAIVGPVVYDGDWYAAAGDGVYQRQNDAYVRIIDTPLIHGIFVGDDGVYVTGEALGDWAAARVRHNPDASSDLDILFLFTDIQTPLLCGDATDQVCAQDWEDWFAEVFPDGLPTQADGDAGTNGDVGADASTDANGDAGSDAGDPGTPASCGCSATRSHNRGAALSMFLAVLVAVRQQRSRRS